LEGRKECSFCRHVWAGHAGRPDPINAEPRVGRCLGRKIAIARGLAYDLSRRRKCDRRPQADRLAVDFDQMILSRRVNVACDAFIASTGVEKGEGHQDGHYFQHDCNICICFTQKKGEIFTDASTRDCLGG